MPSETYHINGSHGSLVVDETGLVLSIENRTSDEYDDIGSVDWEEYVRVYGRRESTDILLIGYWYEDGSYEPPEEQARQIAAEYEHSLCVNDKLVRNVILG